MKFINKHEENLKGNANVHQGHRNRLRAQLSKSKFAEVEDYVLIEYVLQLCIPRKDTNPLAHRLYNEFGSLANVVEASEEDLMKRGGLAQSTAHFLCGLPYIFRSYEQSRTKPRPTIRCPQDIFEYLGKSICLLPTEEFYIICLDGGDKVINKKLISFGGNAEVSIKIQEIVKLALTSNARKVVMVHNHPTTSEDPSIEDLETTKRLYMALSVNGIELSDHLIVNYQEYYYSFSNDGLLSQFDIECKKALK